MAQNKVIRYYSKDLTIVVQFERLDSTVDMSDMVGHEILNTLTNHKFIKDVLRVSGYKVNQRVTTVDWDENKKSFRPNLYTGDLIRKVIQ